MNGKTLGYFKVFAGWSTFSAGVNGCVHADPYAYLTVQSVTIVKKHAGKLNERKIVDRSLQERGHTRDSDVVHIHEVDLRRCERPRMIGSRADTIYFSVEPNPTL
jgi:hypothetical protein